MATSLPLPAKQSQYVMPDKKWFEQELSHIRGLYLLTFDGQWLCSYAGEGCFAALGCSREDFLPRLLQLQVLVCSCGHEGTMTQLLDGVRTTGRQTVFAAQSAGASRLQYLSGSCELVRCPEGGLYLIGQLSDVTESYADDQRQLLDRNGLVQAAQLFFPEMLVININRGTYRMIQYYQATTLGTPKQGNLADMLDLRYKNVYPEDRQAFYDMFSPRHLMEFFSGGENRCQLTYRRCGADGVWHWVETIAVRQDNPYDQDVLVFVMSHSVDEQKARDNAYNFAVRRADYDDMTGVLRKEAGRKYIDEHLASSLGSGGILLALDLDDLKTINDTLGHAYGDKAIIQLTKTLKSHFRKNDIISRVGGDEFVVFLPDAAASVESVGQSLDRLLKKLQQITIADGFRKGLRCSIGCALEHPGQDQYETLYRRADKALYQVKRSGKNSYAFFEGDAGAIQASGADAPETQELGADRQHYASLIVDHTDSACYISDPETHDICYISKAGIKGLGLQDHGEYAGKKCHQVIYGLDTPCPFCTTPYLTLDKHYHWENFNPKNGRWYDITDSLLFADGRMYRMEIAKDISVQKGVQAASPAYQTTMEDVLFRCLNILLLEKDLTKAVNTILQAIGDYYQAKRAYIIEYDLSRDTLSNTFEWCSEGVEAAIDTLQELPRQIVADWDRKFEKDGEFIIHSLRGERNPDSDEYRILESQGIDSLLACPLHSSGQIVGFIGVDDPSRNPGNLKLLRSTAVFIIEELEKRRLLTELESMSYRDPSTKLGNRNLYNRQREAYQANTPKSLGYLSLDINNLRQINETYGHDRGDEVILRVAEILADAYPGQAYHIGSDEFAVFCGGASHADFMQSLSALRQSLYDFLGDKISVGYAWAGSTDSMDIPNLIRQAEEMCIAEKQAYYHMLANGGSRSMPRSTAGELLRLLEEGCFQVYYQPQHDLQTGKVVGAEALVRKRSGEDSVLTPGSFLPFYEMGGVIRHLDLFVLDAACQAIVSWQKQGLVLKISVNFSRITLLESDIVETISAICTGYGVDPSCINIEVTESIGKMDIRQLKELTHRLKARGFSICLDDFGTQYSNLAILTEIDFDEMKLDRSLVTDLAHNEKSRVVTEGCLTMCHALPGTRSLAEGIDTQEQLNILKGYRCQLGQGFYFARPMPRDQFDAYLKEHI